jgi:Carbamoylphosphate synthase large subunit (split gene in MJ)
VVEVVGVAYNEIELHEIVERGLKASLVGQVLVEEYIGHWNKLNMKLCKIMMEIM